MLFWRPGDDKFKEPRLRRSADDGESDGSEEHGPGEEEEEEGEDGQSGSSEREGSNGSDGSEANRTKTVEAMKPQAPSGSHTVLRLRPICLGRQWGFWFMQFFGTPQARCPNAAQARSQTT